MNAHIVFSHPNLQSYNGQLRNVAIQTLRRSWMVGLHKSKHINGRKLAQVSTCAFSFCALATRPVDSKGPLEAAMQVD